MDENCSDHLLQGVSEAEVGAFMGSDCEKMKNLLAVLRNEEQQEAEQLFVQCKELEHQIRQRKLWNEQQKKKREKNRSIFSPLATEEIFCLEKQQEISALEEELHNREEQYKHSTEKRKILEQLENGLSFYFSSIESVPDILEAQEFDRNRIARDLHDSTVQNLTGLIHKVELCSKLLDMDLVRTRLELQSMKEVIRSTIHDMRETIYDLRPISLSDASLSDSVKSLCEHIMKNHNLDIVVHSTGTETKLLPAIKVTIYRIIQEALNNSVKHAKADTIDVFLNYNKMTTEFEVRDNGIGFNLEVGGSYSDKDELHGFGLSTMKDRANLMKGTFSIDTAPGKGTRITVSVPNLYRAERSTEDEQSSKNYHCR